MHSTVAAEFRSRLEADQRSQSWFAQRLGLSKSAMARRMKGASEFTLDEFLAGCRALNANPSEIIAAIEVDSDRSAA